MADEFTDDIRTGADVLHIRRVDVGGAVACELQRTALYVVFELG